MTIEISTDLWDVLKESEEYIDNDNDNDNNSETCTEESEIDLCIHCKSDNLQLDNGHIICKSCGTINNTSIDCNAEWRYYGNDDSKFSDPTRCGLPTNALLPQSSIGSTISFKHNESYDMRKIRNYHMWNAMPYKERALHNVFESIQIRAINSGIPSCIIEEAKILYKKISEKKISRGNNRRGIIASCIYKACCIQGSPRSSQEIADIFKISTKSMTRGCKNFDNIMNYNKHKTIEASSSNSVDFIRRFCSHLNLSESIYQVCKFVCEKAEEHNLVSKCIPPSIAAGSIYLVCSLLNINISKRDISIQCKISEVTISKCYKELLKYHKHLLPDEVTSKLY